MRLRNATTRRLALLLALLAAGCSGEAARPEGASPIVDPASEAGKKAIAESEGLVKLRQQQEAKVRQRRRALPEG